jgi:hypothetical protein
VPIPVVGSPAWLSWLSLILTKVPTYDHRRQAARAPKSDHFTLQHTILLAAEIVVSQLPCGTTEQPPRSIPTTLRGTSNAPPVISSHPHQLCSICELLRETTQLLHLIECRTAFSSCRPPARKRNVAGRCAAIPFSLWPDDYSLFELVNNPPGTSPWLVPAYLNLWMIPWERAVYDLIATR